MRTQKVGVITSGITLILIGIAVFMQMSGAPRYDYFKYVGPIIVILFGVELMWRHFTDREGRARISVLSVLLVIGVFLYGMVQSTAAHGIFNFRLGPTYSEPLQGTVNVDSAVTEVDVSIPNARVTVTGTSSSAVTYDGQVNIGASSQADADEKIKSEWIVRQEGNRLTLSLQREESPHVGVNWLNHQQYINVEVPRQLLTDVTTSNGSVQINSLDAASRVSTSNGSVTAENIKGDVTLDSSNGSITVNDIAGNVDAQTTNGSIKGNSGVAGTWTCSTTNGSIRLTIPSDTSANLDASTTNSSIGGDVSWSHDARHHGTATLGSGNYKVQLRTTNGSVNVNFGN